MILLYFEDFKLSKDMLRAESYESVVSVLSHWLLWVWKRTTFRFGSEPNGLQFSSSKFIAFLLLSDRSLHIEPSSGSQSSASNFLLVIGQFDGLSGKLCLVKGTFTFNEQLLVLNISPANYFESDFIYVAFFVELTAVRFELNQRDAFMNGFWPYHL